MTRFITLSTALAICTSLALLAASAKPKWKDQYAKVNGLRLHFVSQGKGPLILFLHGFPEFWYEWKDQLPEFARDHRAVALDMRGYNLSEKPAGVDAYQMKNLIEDVRALAEHLGYKKLVLVGHDWGGGVAWSFAIAHPEYLSKLVIVNCPHPAILARELVNNPEQQKASQYMLFFRSEQAEKVLSANNYAGLVGAVLGDGLKTGVFTEADKHAYIEAWSQPGALTGGLNYYRAANLGPPAPPKEGEASTATSAFWPGANQTVKVPTLVIWGEKDTALLTGNLDGMDKFVPDLTVKRIPDGSHWVIHEKPALVNGYIREFVR
jgi:pimeloyl-ACP methyl ester carboxylesterase